MAKIRFIIFLLAILLIAAVSYGSALSNATSAGTNAGNLTLGIYGSKSGITGNVSNPMISNTPMYTLDRSKSFTAQLGCPSSNSFLSVLVQPASTGDLQSVIASEDLDMDGTVDYTYQVPVTVSGICANGFISCDAGTWNNCSYYKWAVNNQLQLSAALANITDLGGCYCINNSCGSDLVWSNLGIVLNDLGGGISGALQAMDPQLSISSVNVDGPVISYYGQKSGSCASAGGGTGTGNPQQYYNNWTQLNSDTQAAQTSQAQDPGSYYNLIATSPAVTNSSAQLNNCSLSDVLACSSSSPGFTNNVSDGCQSLEQNTNCRLDDETIDGVQTWSNFTVTGLAPLAPACDSVTVQQIAECPEIQASVYYGRNWSGAPALTFTTTAIDYGADRSWNWWPLGNGVPYSDVFEGTLTVSAAGTYTFTLSADNDGWLYIDGALVADYVGSIGSASGTVSLTAGVHSFKVLHDEDGSGLAGIDVPLPSGVTFSTCPIGNQYACMSRAASGVLSSPSVNGTDYTCPMDASNNANFICFTPPTTNAVCPAFLMENRTYYCSNNSSYDFSDAQKRLANVESTTTDNGSSFYYQDLRDTSSGWVYNGVTSTLPGMTNSSDCELACKTEAITTDTQAGSYGNASQYQANNTQSVQYFYLTCVNSTCPVGAGQTIVEDCQCINDFNEAASVMGVLDAASKDVICSDGSPQPSGW